MVLDQFRLDGKVALVTGANDGIGQSIAVALAEAGADIAVVYRSDCSKTKELITKTGRKFLSIQADLSKMQSVNFVFDAAMKYFGHIDILFNNAGTIIREECSKFTEADWDNVMNLNAKCSFFLTQLVGNQMIEKGIPGRIVNTASLLAFQGGIRIPAYTASKSAIRGLTMALANEWAQYGICVNAIAPGYIATKMTAAVRNDPARNQAILERIPTKRWGVPEDFKGIAVFLASPASAYINGYTIAVDGGWLGR